MEYEWIFEEGVVYGYFFLGFAFYLHFTTQATLIDINFTKRVMSHTTNKYN